MLSKINLNIKCIKLVRTISKAGLVFLFLISLTINGLANPTGPTEKKQQSLLINADEIRRDHALGQMEVFKDAMQSLKEQESPRYKEVRKKYKAAKSLYIKYKYLAEATEKKIRELKKFNPKFLDHINSLETERGHRVYAYLGSKDRFSHFEATGETHISFQSQGGRPKFIMPQEAERGILLLPKKHNAVKILIATDGTLIDVRHEFGHFEGAVTGSMLYYRFLLKAKKRHGGLMCDGHTHNDPTGSIAVAYEKWKE